MAPPSLRVAGHGRRHPARRDPAAVRPLLSAVEGLAGPHARRIRHRAWLWCRSWSSCTADTSTSRASSSSGTTFTVTIPRGSAHLPADQIARRAHAHRRRRWGRRRSSRRRCAGCTTATASPSSSRRSAPRARWSATRRRARPRLPGERILIADDNADMRDYLRRLLEPRWTVEMVDGRRRTRWRSAQAPAAGPGAHRRDDARAGRVRAPAPAARATSGRGAFRS